MDPLRQEMTYEEYLNFPKTLGWKHEYFDGALHRSPAWTAVASFRAPTTVLAAVLAASAVDDGNARLEALEIRSVAREDQAQLLDLFCVCFEQAIEYAGYRPENIIRYGRKSLDGYFREAPAPYQEACQVAVINGCVAGAATIARFEHGAILQPIFVAPAYHRRGVATRLLSESAKRLVDLGCEELRSRCNLGNAASMIWHAKCGFVEIPDEMSAGHRANIFSQEAERYERLNLPNANEMRTLAEFWISERERLYDEKFKDQT